MCSYSIPLVGLRRSLARNELAHSRVGSVVLIEVNLFRCVGACTRLAAQVRAAEGLHILEATRASWAFVRCHSCFRSMCHRWHLFAAHVPSLRVKHRKTCQIIAKEKAVHACRIGKINGRLAILGRWELVAFDPGCVKTPRSITAPGILRLAVTLRAKKRKNSSSARCHDQIRFRFHTAWTGSNRPVRRSCRSLLTARDQSPQCTKQPRQVKTRARSAGPVLDSQSYSELAKPSQAVAPFTYRALAPSTGQRGAGDRGG
jgi:hypothetical protein